MMKIYALLLLQGLFLLLTQAQILAIDYGTQYIKASLVHAGAGKSFSIVENPKSQRKFINSLGLYNQERFYEADTLTKRSRGPTNCFIYSHLLVDLHSSPALVEAVKKDLVLEYVRDPKADQLLAEFVLNGFPEGEDRISLLETVAMMLKYIKLQAEKATKGTLKDAILIVPNHWNIHQRRFLTQAAELADLSVLSLIHENTGAAINYALSQRSTNDTENVLFYNVGANSFQMTLAQFKLEKSDKNTKGVESIFILGDYGRPYLGGLKFDALIANFFAKKFEEKHKRTLSQRGMIRLLSESEKMKLVLSANKQATVFVEGIMDGIDFSAVISRPEFERLADSTLLELTNPIKRFLFDHDLRPEDLSGIELIGGGTRIPKLQTLIADAVGNKSLIGSHINGDESMVLGAAFYGANSSKKFKVKGINLYDGFNFEMRLVLRNAEEEISEDDNRYYFKNVTLFKKKSRFGLTKEVNFKCRENLIVDVYREDETGLELITSHKIDSIKDINETGYKVSLTFEINPISVVQLTDVKYLYQKEVSQSYTEKVRKAPQPKNETEEKEEEKSAEEQEEKTEEEKEKDEEEGEQAEKEEKEETSKDKEKESKKKSDKKKGKKREKIEYETVQRFRNVTKNFEKVLAYKEQYKLLKDSNSDEVKRSKRVFSRYEAQEEAKRRLAESKNKLQALIYEIRDKIEMEEFVKYTQPKEKTQLQKLLKQKGEWYDDTVSGESEDYRKKFRELNDPVEKIKKRMIEHREREEVRKRALSIISEYTNLTSKIQKGKEWITDEEVADLTKNISDSKQRVENLYKQLIEVPINEDSIFHNKDLIKETDSVKDQYFLLKGKPKPKAAKKEKVQKEKQEKSEESGSKDDVNEDEL